MAVKKRAAAILLALAVVVLVFPPVAAKADISSGLGAGTEMGDVTKPYRRDENYIDVQPGDIDIWDNGKGISFSAGGEICSLNHSYNQYLVLISKYLDSDGKYTLQVNIFIYSSSATFNPEAILISDDGSVYVNVRLGYDVYEYCVKMRDGMFLSPDDTWTQDVELYYSNRGSSSAFTSRFGFCVAPYYSGKYIIYSSYETLVSSPSQGFPVNLLPNAPLGAGSTNIPYKTTFRMLTGEATVYNTFYYTSSYQSGADAISAAGTIRLDATKLVDGSVTRTRPSAPQLLCQISTYGTAYDIVSTNDDNLCSLLGITRPAEKYWDVSSQEWKDVTPGSGGIGGDLPTITPEPGINTIDHSLSPLSNFVAWLAAKGYSVATDVVYFFGDVDSAYGAFESLLEEYLGYFTYNETVGKFGYIGDGVSDEWKKISDSSVVGLIQKDFTDRFSYDTARQAYTWSPTAVASVGVAGLNAGLGVGASGTGGSGAPAPGGPDTSPGSGSGSEGTGSGGSGSGPGSGGITIIDGPDWDIISNISGSVQTGIADSVSSTGSFLSGVLGSAKGILLDLGGVPALLAEFFSFLPAEIITAIGIGLSLWLLPALLSLARSGLRGLGGICSSLFGFISSFFS